MRIAVCMYGQPRTWKKCVDWIQESYDLEGSTIDYFCNVKNYNTEKATGVKTKISDAEIDQLLLDYSPKKHFVEQIDGFNGHGGFSSTMLSIVNSINLKQMYEQEKGILYDLCILQRYDCLTGPEQDWLYRFIVDTNPKTMAIYITKDFIHFGQDCFKAGITDLLIMGHNTAMDALAANLINNFCPGSTMEKIVDAHLYTPHVMLRDACMQNNIRIIEYAIDSLLIREDSNLEGGILQNWRELSDFWKPK